MKQTVKKLCAITGILVAMTAGQSAMADGGWGRHHGGHGHGQYRGWAPFALGAVVGGMAIGAMMTPPPVVAQPVYPPPQGYYARPKMMPQPIYVVPAPSAQMYYAY